MENTKDVIIDIVLKILANNNIDFSTQITETELLKNVGLDSLLLIELIVLIEEYFEIEIPDVYLVEEEINTIRKLTVIVDKIKENQ